MKYLIISDVHQNQNSLEAVLRKEGVQIHGIIFLGDGLALLKKIAGSRYPLFAVSGNMDGGHKDIERIFSIEPYRIFITHGHFFDVKSGMFLLYDYGVKNNFDFVLFGHTHTPFYYKKEKTVFINPGALMNGLYGVLELEKEYFHYEACQI